jgi:hypothetical protein
METHNSPSTSSSFIIHSGKQGGAAVLGGGGDIVILGGDCFSLNINILGKTAELHLAHFCGWGCAELSLQFI